MEYKKLFIFICFIICLFSIASVCASDANQTVVTSEEINQELNLSDVNVLSASADDINDDALYSNEGGDILADKPDSSLSNLGDIALEYGDEANIAVAAIGATGITAKIDGNAIGVAGYTIMIPSNLNVGTHQLSVSTIPDDNHNSVTKTATITINKAQSLRDIDDITLNYGNSSAVRLYTIGVTKIIAEIDGNDVDVKGNEITVPVLDVGTHILSVTTVPDDNHIAATKTATITVNKVDSSVGMGNLTFNYGSFSNITVTTEGVVKFTAKIDGKDADVVGNTIMIPAKLNVGTHTLSVTTVADSNHNPVTRTATITVKKADYLSNIVDVNLTYGTSLNIALNDDESITYKAQIDGKEINIFENHIILPKLEVGTHKLTVSIVKDANHDGATKTATIIVTKAKTNLVTRDLTANEGQKVTLTAGMGGVDLINEGVVAFFYGNTKLGQANVINSIAELTYTPLKSGVHTISVVYEGTSRYESSRSSFKLAVNEKTNYTYVTNSSIVIIPSSGGSSYNDTAVISLPSDVTGTITLTVEGVDYKSALVNGVANIKLPNLEDGVYAYVISYSGDEQYSPFKNNGSFNVTKTHSDDIENVSSKMDIDFPSFGTVPSGSSIPIKLPDDATGTFTLTVNGVSYDFAVEKGVATVKMPNLGAGNYPFTITYSGDSKYSSFTRSGTLFKSNTAVAPVITASNMDVVYSDGSYYSIKVTGTDGKAANGVAVKITGKISKTITTKNGVARFKISQVPGTYKIKITSLGKSVTKTITVKHLLTLKSVTVKKSAKSLVLQATLGKINGKYLNKKTVTFKFNGKTYSAKTNSKGVAKATVKSSVLKKITVGKKITYQATYLKDTVKKNAVVKK